MSEEIEKSVAVTEEDTAAEITEQIIEQEEIVNQEETPITEETSQAEETPSEEKAPEVEEVLEEESVPETEEVSQEEETPEVEEETSEEWCMTEEQMNDLSSKSLKEITLLFEQLLERGDQQEMYKYAEGIKTAFYKALKREKIAVGFIPPAETPFMEDDTTETKEGESEDTIISNNPFAEIERGFKDLFAKYKSSRSIFLQNLERKKEENYTVKLSIIEELKGLLETQEDINRTFPLFRTLQTKWRETGPVPQNKVKDIYDTYQHYVELFYDYVKINNELRDLDFKKNLEAKIDLCEKAEKLIEEDNVVNAFAKLQKLHEEWKEFGPVEKEHREEIWERFKLATAQINKKHQGHFEKIKENQKENLLLKSAICEKAEEIASREINDSNAWNKASKEIENLQKEWKTIGFASKKDNQKIYDRFRAACDGFYGKKRDYYSQFKDQMTQNYEKKVALCERAEALKESTDWKATSDQLIAIQKEWRETGPVSRKKSDMIWNRFRAACDYFFNNKEKQFGGVDPQYVDNLNKKLALLKEIEEYVKGSEREESVIRSFYSRWNEIGFVPFKEKDKIQEQFRSLTDKLGGVKYAHRPARDVREQRAPRDNNPIRSEREKLLQKFRKKESEISTYENNIGFFASSKNADAFVKEFNKKIEAAKIELHELEEKIKSIDKQFE